MHIVLGANPEADQPWVVDAVADLIRQSGGSVAVVAVDEVELERLAAAPRSVFAERAQRAASTAVQRLAAVGIEASQTVLSGRPLQQILDFADQQQADLIVVGSSTRPAVAERLLGSLPLALIEKSPRPVLVITNPHRSR
ncbi:universal stress protein [Plantactinospora sp. S1510]|uniref:Universal stress protein n=1 Tax=Plantactinospora alkalitolerans TaxID=2789879 RepID=A0ABS0GU53_9ACTN|nr:universal stress protein [Plantactinospora alkalitolerans]MBF9129742.1 universal stress protein [Plantactinospora alkalitolerans]